MRHPSPSPAANPAPTHPAPRDAQTAAHALAERQMVLLTRLAEIGMDIAEAAGRCARDWLDAEPPAEADGAEAPDASTARPPFPADAGLTYARISRAIRLTLALQTQLTTDLAKLDRGLADTRRSRIYRLVERAVETEDCDVFETEHLRREARERLRDEEVFGDLAALPLIEAVAAICKDLGLSADVSGWFEEPFADESPPPPHEPVTEPPPAPPRSPVAVQRRQRSKGDADGDGDGGDDPGAGGLRGARLRGGGPGGGQEPDRGAGLGRSAGADPDRDRAGGVQPARL
jgi:hypothetical protein